MTLQELLTAIACRPNSLGHFIPHQEAWMGADVLVDVNGEVYRLDAQAMEWDPKGPKPYTLTLGAGERIA